MELPEGWRVSTVEDTCEILDRLRVPLNAEQRLSMQGEYPYWGANNIVGYVNDFIFDEPLVLMAEDGGYFSEAATRPICNLLDGKCWVNNHAHVLRVGPGNLREWVYYWFVHRDITTYIKGGTRTKLNQQDLKKLPILLPPLAEQKKIAAILASVDEVIQATQAVIDQTRKVKQGLLQRLLTRGIGHTRFKQTEIGEIPESWDVMPLADATERLHNGFVETAAPHYRAEGVPYLMSRNVRANQLDLATLTFISTEFHTGGARRSQLRGGDVLIVQSGHVGTACCVTVDFAGANCHAVIIATPRAEQLRGDFLAFYLNSEVGRQRLSSIYVGSTVPHINTKSLRRFLIPVPPHDEQRAIESQALALDAATVIGQATLRQQLLLKSALMSDLLSGRVRVKVDA